MNRKETNMEELLHTLQAQAVIPEVVQKKAEDAFAAIQREAAHRERQKRSSSGYAYGNGQKYRKNRKKKFVLVMLAAVLAFGTISMAAVYLRQSKSLTEGLRSTKQQQEQMQEEHMTTIVGQSFTDQGITVTAMESITDQYFTHIAFRVEGYQVDEGVQPDFESVRVTVDGQDDFSYSGSFYSGIVAGTDGKPEYADGSPVQTNADGRIIERYSMEDGSLEFQITLFNTEEKGFFINQPIHVELQNLGTVDKAAHQSDVKGIWTFDWTLEGSPEIKKCDLNVPLGDSGALAARVELSPISLMVEYQFPHQKKQEMYQDENGQEKIGAFDAEPPQLTGVRMKDGTIYSNIYRGPGSSGYESEESSVYRTVFAIDRILDVEQVESLLFLKPNAEEGKSIEDQYDIVPIE